MAVQLIPLIKTLAPYLTTIATSAIPAFTAKSEAAKSESVVAQQITELQSAVTHNAESLHMLAEQLQKVLNSAEEASETARRQIAGYKALVLASGLISLLSLSIALYSVWL